MSKVVVIGSINMDLVVRVEEIPKPGETVMGKNLMRIPGGKGANQAAAMAKLGVETVFLGKVGEDGFGAELKSSMLNAGIEISKIETEKGPSGIAIINVDNQGNNNIVVISGANGLMDTSYLKNNAAQFEADIFVFQLEIPLETVRMGLKMAKQNEKLTVLNPAPATKLDDEIISLVDILIPNEHELQRLTDVKIDDEKSIKRACNILLKKGVKNLIVTLGKNGVYYTDGKVQKFFKAYEVDAVDTTAAGDSFIGGFVAALSEQKDIETAIDYGQICAALTVQREGAQISLPSLDEFKAFKKERLK
ncbi:MAG: ribokinase [Tissierellia bacterium]|nr:ribokinase [Tissierellia bacterium]